jgi:hypothetical protein
VILSSNTAPEATLLNAHIKVPQHVVYRSFPAETVVLNLQTGRYHGLNPSGGRMLEELQRAPSVGAAVVTLAEDYDAPRAEIERDVLDLCEALHQRGLIEIDDAREP